MKRPTGALWVVGRRACVVHGCYRDTRAAAAAVDANPFWDYFGEDHAGPRGLGHRSFDLGGWHVIYLNDNAAHVPFAAGSVQDQCVQQDLAANTKSCTIVFFHQPYTYSNTSTRTRRT